MLKGDGSELRGELLAMGVLLDPSNPGRQRMVEYLQWRTPQRHIHCALQVGWCGSVFVLPDIVIGGGDDVIFQSGDRGHGDHGLAGTLEGWREGIAAKAVGNSYLMMTLSASFAGALLHKCSAESGGFHFLGDSSMGKSGALDAVCATWGGAGFKRTWNSTANGMEGIAALHNDCVLVLDEIGQCEPDDVGAIVYSLGNGTGKQRAGRTGAALGVAKWRCIFLSSGEISLETVMNNAGQAVKSGQEMRLLQVPLKMGLHGAWNILHGAGNGADFTENLKREALKNYGHAGREFLRRLTSDGRDFCLDLDRIKASPLFSCESGEGQEKRAAARFALVALAGEVASEYGLTRWAAGEATQAAADCFKLWQSIRAKGNSEHWQIIRKVASFIERHGDGRFSPRHGLQEVPLHDRAGWWEDGEIDGRVYFFNASAMREALKGMDFERGLDALQACGALPPAEAGSNVRSKNKKMFGRQIRLYPINPAKLNVND